MEELNVPVTLIVLLDIGVQTPVKSMKAEQKSDETMK